MERPLDNGESLGAGLKPGDAHYRAYVGPPEDYDLIAAMTFNLLTTLGLRQHHSLLDVGCGSLRIGRLLIPYLNLGKYFGVEPNEWLVKEGIKQELGEGLLQIKRPTFFFSDSPDTITQAKVSFDFALAQSIFSHCGLDLIKNWLSAISRSLAEDGALVATFLPGEEDSPTKGWVYPECVNYKPATMRQAAAEAGLRFEILDWKHPRQTWALFAAPKFDSTWLRNRPLTWNARLEKVLAKNKAGCVAPAVPPASTNFSHAEGHVYDQDGLRSIHNHEFMDDPAFRKAYERGIRAARDDYRWHWRVHIGLWAAACAARLEGDFVECGVNRGFLASAIMDYLNWDSLGKHFYLLDTFRGLDERFVSSADRASGAVEKNQKSLTSGFYVEGIEEVQANFSQWKNVSLIEGSIPETLPQIRAKKIAYLHLDMNCSMPEIAAIQFVWDRLVPGALVLLDDYAYYGYFSQKLAMDQFAQEKGIKILSLPTGQGLVLKPLDAH
ncbi:MAG TPA: class I SAM-dependent methyltransferase [Candidatus Udaeobacter sp.]|nr:class I SAM-dependent methyltransferase [Candidatus Udaeobacter sp.]